MTRQTAARHGTLSEVQLLDQILRTDFAVFTQKAFETAAPGVIYVPGWHIDYLSSVLQHCIDGDITRAIINMPPRHMKSILASVALPAFMLGLDPTLRIICVSYSSDLAVNLSRLCRQVMQQPWYQRAFPATRLSTTKNTEDDFETTKGGGRLATSVGGTLTGRGGQVIIIDDPLKANEATSKSKREAVNDWFDGTLYSRLDGRETGRIIVVAQRLHQDDLTGHLLAKKPNRWELIKLPSICPEDQTIQWGDHPRQAHHWKKDEALWPQCQSLAVLTDMKTTLGTPSFNAQYLQEPVPPQGNLFKAEWFHDYDGDPPLLDSADPANSHIKPGYIMQSWDTASKTDQLNDYSVCTTWYMFMKKFYLLDVYRARLTFPDLKHKVVELAGRQYTSRRISVRRVLIEDMGTGTPLIQQLRREPHDFSTIAFKPKGDKTFRFQDAAAYFEGEQVFLPRSAPWLDDYKTELLGFPDTRFDDQVDSTSQLLVHVKKPGISQGRIINAYC